MKTRLARFNSHILGTSTDNMYIIHDQPLILKQSGGGGQMLGRFNKNKRKSCENKVK